MHNFTYALDMLSANTTAIATNSSINGWDASCWILVAGVLIAAVGLGFTYVQIKKVSEQLSLLKKSFDASVLFEIDRKFEEIAEARAFVREIAEAVLFEAEKNKLSNEEYHDHLTKKWMDFRNASNKDDYKEIRKVLDFCESVGFYAENEYVSHKDICNLWGEAISTWVDWFRGYIEYRQKEVKNKFVYRYSLLIADYCEQRICENNKECEAIN